MYYRPYWSLVLLIISLDRSRIKIRLQVTNRERRTLHPLCRSFLCACRSKNSRRKSWYGFVVKKIFAVKNKKKRTKRGRHT